MPGFSLTSIVGITIGVGVLTEIVYQIYLRWYDKPKERSGGTEVIFFPDKQVACVEHFTNATRCLLENCKFSHEDNSLSKLFTTLSKANKSMDVCVFVLTCGDLCDILIKAHKRGVCVRVITDCEQVETPGSQIWRLRSEGIALRTDDSSFFMHHKFVVIDGTKLVNGSFNWTRQAITGNQENLLITDSKAIVSRYQQQFTKLWHKYDPKRRSP